MSERLVNCDVEGCTEPWVLLRSGADGSARTRQHLCEAHRELHVQVYRPDARGTFNDEAAAQVPYLKQRLGRKGYAAYVARTQQRVKVVPTLYTDCRAYPLTGPHRCDGREPDEPAGPLEYCWKCGWQDVGYHAARENDNGS